MLEGIISSRIRRALFEYLLTHPKDQFYLRGLAKDLNLSISPLRRELKRLERTGVLKASTEGNMLFYTVNADSPFFLQLQQATKTEEPQKVSNTESVAVSDTADASSVRKVSDTERPVSNTESQKVSDTDLGELKRHEVSDTVEARPRGRFWTAPLGGLVLGASALVGLALVVIIVGVFYISITNQKLITTLQSSLKEEIRDVAVSAAKEGSPGGMRGSRWRIVPGGIGGFGTSQNQEVY